MKPKTTQTAIVLISIFLSNCSAAEMTTEAGVLPKPSIPVHNNNTYSSYPKFNKLFRLKRQLHNRSECM
jgi:hypothetical protein